MKGLKVGDEVKILAKEHQTYGEHGLIVAIDEDGYFVVVTRCGELPFARGELRKGEVNGSTTNQEDHS